jgi:hypothetical protein
VSVRRSFAIGRILLIGGLVVVAFGTIFPSSNPVMALGWLLLAPSLLSCCGATFVFVSLARSAEAASRSGTVYRIIGSAAIAGLGLALAYGVAGTLSQLPDTLAGLNGPFIPGRASPSMFFLSGVGFAVGIVIGTIDALVWWRLRGRHLLILDATDHFD